MKDQKLVIYLIALVIILTSAILYVLFHSNKIISDNKTRIEQLQIENRQRDSIIQVIDFSKKKDSILFSTLLKSIFIIDSNISRLKNSEIKIIREYDSIPNIVNSYSIDSLRNAFIQPD